MMKGTFVILTEEQFNEITNKLDRLMQLLQNPQSTSYKLLGKWISEEEALQLLGKGKTTLWKLRTKGLVSFSRIGKSIFYDVESIVKILEKNSVKSFR